MATSLIASVSCLVFVAISVSGDADVSPACVQCICEAVSGGPACVLRGGGTCHDGVCGPFAITMPYWQDAGRPTRGLEDRQTVQAYENCALDATCSEATIRGYMNKFHQDCNGDGVEDCEDYAFIHFHGGYGCNRPLSVPAQNQFADCMQRLSNPPPFEQPTEDNDILFPKTPYPSIDIRGPGDSE